MQTNEKDSLEAKLKKEKAQEVGDSKDAQLGQQGVSGQPGDNFHTDKATIATHSAQGPPQGGNARISNGIPSNSSGQTRMIE